MSAAPRIVGPGPGPSEDRGSVVAELHDLLGHHLSLIHLQADVALVALDHDPARARASLVAIRDASGRVLHEIRAALGVLDDFSAGSPVALADLGALVAAARAAGQPVALRVLGRERPVPPAVGHAVCRVVQESLTDAPAALPGRRLPSRSRLCTGCATSWCRSTTTVRSPPPRPGSVDAVWARCATAWSGSVVRSTWDRAAPAASGSGRGYRSERPPRRSRNGGAVSEIEVPRGIVRPWAADALRVLLAADDADDALGIVEMELAAGSAGPPLHVHPTHGEGFYVLAGEIRPARARGCRRRSGARGRSRPGTRRTRWPTSVRCLPGCCVCVRPGRVRAVSSACSPVPISRRRRPNARPAWSGRHCPVSLSSSRSGAALPSTARRRSPGRSLQRRPSNRSRGERERSLFTIAAMRNMTRFAESWEPRRGVRRPRRRPTGARNRGRAVRLGRRVGAGRRGVAASETAYTVLRVVGAAFLVVLGVQAWLASRAVSTSRPTRHRQSPAGGGGGLCGDAAEQSQVAVFMVASSAARTRRCRRRPTTLLLGMVQLVVDGGWFLLLAVFASRAGRLVGKAKFGRWLDRRAGTVLIGLGARMGDPDLNPAGRMEKA